MRCKACRGELGWRTPASPWILPCRKEVSPISILRSSKTTTKATILIHQLWFPRLLLGNAPSLPPPPLPPPHQRDGVEEGLLDGVTWGWSHHRNGDSGLICTPSCSPAARREHRSCCRYSHSWSTLSVLQNRVKQYQRTQGRIFGANHFLNCSSNMRSLNQKPCNEPLTCTSRYTYRAFSMHMYQAENLISWFYYFDVCQKSSNFSKSIM